MAVVVLGNQLESEQIHPRLQGRMDVGIEVFRSTGAEHLVLTGGQSNVDIPVAECDVMRDYAVEQGVDPDRIHLDDKALDTVGNGYFTRLIVDGLDGVDTVYVVSSCYHMERAEYIFEQCFGPDYDVVADDCYEADLPEEELHEERGFRRARTFFEPIEPGDVDAIRERLNEAHVLYDDVGT